MTSDILQAQASKYAELCGISLDLKTPLGYGNDGRVWKSSRKSAVKAFERASNFRRESQCYRRLTEHNVRTICGLTIPHLIRIDESLLIVEMRLVAPPYLLDFGKAYLDTPPEYPPDAMEDWEAQGVENFGAERWLDVKRIIRQLKSHGIYYYDAKPGNINFGDPDDEP